MKWQAFPMLHGSTVVLLVFSLGLLLTGCQSVSTLGAAPSVRALQGRMKGGEQPVIGAQVQLYAVGLEGTASAAVPLLSQPAISDNAGNFNITAYTCPSANAAVYLLANGGNGSVNGAGKNVPAIGLMAMLGPCGALNDASYIVVNEQSTVGSIWPFASHMSAPAKLGFPAGDGALATSLGEVAQLVNVNYGNPPATLPAALASKLATLADILAACVNSAGGVAGDGSICGYLFQLATPPNGTPPQDTATAAMNIAQNPFRNVSPLYNLTPAASPFEPSLPQAPADWTLLPTAATAPSTPVISPGSGSFAAPVQVSIADLTPGALLYYTSDGSLPTAGSTLYSGPFMISASASLHAIAIANGVSSAPAAATYTIAAQVPKGLTFVGQPGGVAMGSRFLSPVAVVAVDASGNPVPSANVPVTLALVGNGGSGSLTGTLTQSAAQTPATFADITVTQPGAGYQIRASSPGLPSVTSSSFPVYSVTSQPALWSDSFVDTIGVNVHFSWLGTPYDLQFPAALAALHTLGVRHVRDGLSDLGMDPNAFYYQRHNQLGAIGIKSIFNVPINENPAMLLAYPGLVNDFEGYEGPNEYDQSGDPNWVANLTAYQQLLYRTVKGNRSTAQYPVLGPPLVATSSWPLVAGLKSYMDFGPLHNYYAGFNPGTTGSYSIPSAMQNLHAGWAGVPVITTETGYIYQEFLHILPDVAGTYMPRVALEQYLAGVKRTYIYELIDKDSTEYGMMEADLTPRPAFMAMTHLIGLLSDPGSTLQPANLQFALSGNTANVHHLLLEKQNGAYFLALWIESQDYDQAKEVYLTVPNQTVNLAVQTLAAGPTVYQFDPTGNVTPSSLAPAASFTLSVSPNVMIVQLTPAKQ